MTNRNPRKLRMNECVESCLIGFPFEMVDSSIGPIHLIGSHNRIHGVAVYVI